MTAQSNPYFHKTSEIQVFGVETSPFTAKVRAALRYQRISYRWRCTYPQFDPYLADLKPKLMPVVTFPDGTSRIDSTPILIDLDNKAPTRSVRPEDRALDLFSLLIEDMADELLNRAALRFRFGDDIDPEFSANWVMDDTYPALSHAELLSRGCAFQRRQLSRRDLVGVYRGNYPVFEDVFSSTLEAMNSATGRDTFLFGSRPSLGDFGIFAQLYLLCSDPVPQAIIRQCAPRVEYWTRRMIDLSGVDGSWQDSTEPNAAVRQLLNLVGDIHLPLLEANAAAYAREQPMYTIDVSAGRITLPTYGYHVKCLAALRAAFAALTNEEKDRACGVLERAGCLPYMTSDAAS